MPDGLRSRSSSGARVCEEGARRAIMLRSCNRLEGKHFI